MIEVILAEDVPSLGRMGDVVRVRDGYARNYLLPRKLGVKADAKSVKARDHQKRMIEDRKRRLRGDAEREKAKIESCTITIAARAGEEEKLFGSVTNIDLEKALEKEGFKISRKDILLENPIKALGQYTVPAKLATGITAEIKLSVVAQDSNQS